MRTLKIATFLILSIGPFLLFSQPDSWDFSCGNDGTTVGPDTIDPTRSIICDNLNEIRYLRLAFHVLLRPVSEYSPLYLEDKCNELPFTYIGQGNFTETSDGYNDLNFTGYDWAETIIESANNELANNNDQWRKQSGEYYPPEPPDVNMRYILSGVYFHRDQAAWDATKDYSVIHSQYNVGGDEILDVYLSPNFPHSGKGLGGSNTNKYVFMRLYFTYLSLDCREWAKDKYGGQLLNHEIGHTLGLSHTWNSPDGCDDTPLGFDNDPDPDPDETDYVTCWRRCSDNNCNQVPPDLNSCADETPWCCSWDWISNNIMDYNQYYPHAYTTCQNERLNVILNGSGNGYIYSCDGCMPAQAHANINDIIHICPPTSSVIFDGSGSFNEDLFQIEICDITQGGSTSNCSIGYFNSGWLSGIVGSIDLAAFYQFTVGNTYEIKLSVDNSACQNVATFTKNIEIEGCLPGTPCGCFNFGQVNNPFSSTLSVPYTTTQNGILTMYLVHSSTGIVTWITPTTSITSGSYNTNVNTSNVPSGLYYLIAIYNDESFSQSITKF